MGWPRGAGIAFVIIAAAISGMRVIAHARIVALVIGTLLLTAVATGWLAGLWL